MTPPNRVAADHLGGAEVGDRKADELATRGDVKLQEDLAQVVLHRPWADEQLGADLRVGKTISGQSSDVCLLWCEHAARIVGSPARGLARGQELVTGALGKPLDPDGAEHFVGGSELLTSVDTPTLATKPLAVKEPRTGEVDYATAPSEPLDRLVVKRLRIVSLA